MTLHILSVNDEQLSVVLQALSKEQTPIAKEVAIRFKRMATPVAIEAEEKINEHAG
jgi:plasmid stability protein